MRVTRIVVGAVRSNGNFGNDSIEVEVEVGPEDNPVEAFDRAKSFAWARLAGGSAELRERFISKAICCEAEAKEAQQAAAEARAAAEELALDIPF